MLTVNLTQPKITWEKSLTEGSSGSGRPLAMSSGNCIRFKSYVGRPITKAPLGSYRENRPNTKLVRINFSLLLTVEVMWPAGPSSCLCDCPVVIDCHQMPKPNKPFLSCFLSGGLITATEMSLEHSYQTGLGEWRTMVRIYLRSL